MALPEPLVFARRGDHRVVAGVAGGFADRHGADALVVRCAVFLLAFMGGIGVALYAFGGFVSRPPGTDVGSAHPLDPRRNLSVGAVTLGTALVTRALHLWPGDAFMVPLMVVVAGIAIAGVLRPGAGRSASGAAPLADVLAGKHARARVIVGAALVALGLVLVGVQDDVSGRLRSGVFATAVTIVGVAILFAPWLARLTQEVAEERRQRIRSEEREAMAAHLHDSVLQTLALIQRTADDPRRTVALARQQERELREWLYGTAAEGEAGSSLAGAVRAMAGEVEALYGVRIEAVVVGDLTVDERTSALTAALREACVNAAKHSGVAEASLYVEVGDSAVEGWVRDRGRGFERETGPSDRRGIAQSIEGRMERVGGTATVDSTPGQGTEVHVVLPVRAAEPASQ